MAVSIVRLPVVVAVVVDPIVANFPSFFFWVLLGELVPSLHRR